MLDVLITIFTNMSLVPIGSTLSYFLLGIRASRGIHLILLSVDLMSIFLSTNHSIYRMDKLLTYIQNATARLVHFSTLPFVPSGIEGLVSPHEFQRWRKGSGKTPLVHKLHNFPTFFFLNNEWLDTLYLSLYYAFLLVCLVAYCLVLLLVIRKLSCLSTIK